MEQIKQAGQIEQREQMEQREQGKSPVFALEKYGDALALFQEDGASLSYRALWEEGDALYAKIPEGRRLAFLLCENSIGALLGYTAFLNHGIVPALLSSEIDRGLFAALLENYDPSLVWAPEGWFPEGEVLFSSHGYALHFRKNAPPIPLHRELALLLTTSGSTGSPKFVRQSYENIRSNAEAIITYLELNAAERPITTLPMQYTYGLSILNSHLMVGACILLSGRGILQREFWQFFTSQNATSLAGVPYTYEMFQRLHLERMELPSLKTLTQAGGKLPRELHTFFASYAASSGRRFFVMYGSCEATARMGYLPWDKSLEKAGSIGIAIPGGSFSLLDADGREITEAGQSGELLYRGKNVTLGYAECAADLARGDDFHGILHTGDVAQFDEDGYYTIVGRKKRFLKIFGNRVNLEEIDRLLLSEFGDADFASAGQDDALTLYFTDPSRGEAEISFLSQKTGLPRKAFHYQTLPAIPRNEAGKVLYGKLGQASSLF